MDINDVESAVNIFDREVFLARAVCVFTDTDRPGPMHTEAYPVTHGYPYRLCHSIADLLHGLRYALEAHAFLTLACVTCMWAC